MSMEVPKALTLLQQHNLVAFYAFCTLLFALDVKLVGDSQIFFMD